MVNALRSFAEWMLSRMAPETGEAERRELEFWPSCGFRYNRDNKGEETSGHAGAVQGHHHLPRPGEAGAEVPTGGEDSGIGRVPSGQHPDSKGDISGHSNSGKESHHAMVVGGFGMRVSPYIIFSSKKITR